MQLGSVFKMRMSILNTATTEQMGYGIFSFFVYMKSTDQNLSLKTHSHNNSGDTDDTSQKVRWSADILPFS